ncbi:protease PrsW, partial [Salmonella enterica subsp. enterica serovar Senftenberg]|nr:protease PrsW [Salmonella enterica subsp. enterica serovar Senftenberg]
MAGTGGQGAARRSGRQALRRWLFAAFIVIGFALAALVLVAYYGATLGVVTSLLGVLLAAIPLGIV